MTSHIVARATMDKLSKDHFDVLLFGPKPGGTNDSHLGEKLGNVRGDIEDNFKHANVEYLLDPDIQTDLKNIKKATGSQYGGYLDVLLKKYAPATDLFIFFLGRNTEGTHDEVRALGLNPQYGPRCCVVFDEDQLDEDGGEITQNDSTYWGRIHKLAVGSSGPEHLPAIMDGMSAQDIKACHAWSSVRGFIKGFLAYRAWRRREEGRLT